jgi:uncharacterized membrane protein YqjE
MRDAEGPGGPRDYSGADRPTAAETGGRPFSELLQDIVANLQEIVRSEIRLAKTELSEETQKTIRAAAFLVAGGLLGLYALGFLLLSAVYALAIVLPDWLAPLLVALLVAVVAGALLMIGRNRLKSVSPLPKTVSSVKEDIQWAKNQTK